MYTRTHAPTATPTGSASYTTSGNECTGTASYTTSGNEYTFKASYIVNGNECTMTASCMTSGNACTGTPSPRHASSSAWIASSYYSQAMELRNGVVCTPQAASPMTTHAPLQEDDDVGTRVVMTSPSTLPSSPSTPLATHPQPRAPEATATTLPHTHVAVESATVAETDTHTHTHAHMEEDGGAWWTPGLEYTGRAGTKRSALVAALAVVGGAAKRASH